MTEVFNFFKISNSPIIFIVLLFSGTRYCTRKNPSLIWPIMSKVRDWS